MKPILILTVIWGTLLAGPAFAQDHADVVANAKAALLSTGANLSGPCGAFAITKVVAWQLRAEGAGLFSKPTGNNCEGYSTDFIVYPDGRAFDILGDAGTDNAPMWQSKPPEDPARWRPPIPLVTDAPPVVPPPPLPSTPTCDVSALSDQIAALTAKAETSFAEQHQFIEDARDRYRKVATFVAKYGAVIMGAILAGRISK